jgi:hypothetical protein
VIKNGDDILLDTDLKYEETITLPEEPSKE